MLQIHVLPALNDNYIFMIISNNEVAVIDPGDAKVVLDFLEKNNLPLTKIFCTHHHPDHIAGNLELKKRTKCRIYGAHYDKDRIPGIDETLNEGNTVTLGLAMATVIETWGHTLGHISYHFAEHKKIFCGDTLFSAGCGRLFEGTAEQMFLSLQKIAQLPEDTEVYCGHEYTESNIRFALSIDPRNDALVKYATCIHQKRKERKFSIPTTLEVEKKVNPFLRCDSKEIRSKLSMESCSDKDVFAKLRHCKDQF